MKKRLIFIFLSLIISLVIIWNIPMDDNKWTKQLINGYVIRKEASDKINIGIISKDKFISKISDYVFEYSYGKRYILLKCLDNKNGLVINYYIIDSLDNIVYGKYSSYQEFNEKVLELDDNFSEYVKTIDIDK